MVFSMTPPFVLVKFSLHSFHLLSIYFFNFKQKQLQPYVL
ncbi:hypothetical protein PFLA_a3549 [Pseudoalteromonas flavipulchra NCIMB 2033 = ATCC BAA-314]|nr:hypothetical protein [Pseudoalteromonas flavipulchra NCIMB 2033 = ATCC BAA-314]